MNHGIISGSVQITRHQILLTACSSFFNHFVSSIKISEISTMTTPQLPTTTPENVQQLLNRAQSL
ncbi:MAG: hypothetical protein L0I08_07285, partial [Enterobacterales bacterium]|nr:hypothetical protein [Enterobacterales bacterium]